MPLFDISYMNHEQVSIPPFDISIMNRQREPVPLFGILFFECQVIPNVIIVSIMNSWHIYV